MTEIIYTDRGRDLEIRLDSQMPPDLLELLEATVWGQHGVVFRALDMAEMLRDLTAPSFLRLMKRGRIVAAAVRSRKRVQMAGTPYNAIHLALFAVHPEFTQQGLGTVLARVSRTHYLSVLEPPGLFYGYIESGNEASLRLNLGLGYRDLGEVRARIFSRARPRASARVEALRKEELPEMLGRLNETYRDHVLCSFEQSLDAEHYFIVRQKGEIVAGAQLHVLHWELMRLPGCWGRLVLGLLPHLPLLGREFRPADMRFARAGHMYAAEGAEPLVAEIIETALAEQHLPFAAALVDPRGKPERRMLDAIDFGLLDRAITGAFHLVGEFKGVHECEIAALSKAPVIISPKDLL